MNECRISAPATPIRQEIHDGRLFELSAAPGSPLPLRRRAAV